jgi:hypothetical protein
MLDLLLQEADFGRSEGEEVMDAVVQLGFGGGQGAAGGLGNSIGWGGAAAPGCADRAGESWDCAAGQRR